MAPNAVSRENPNRESKHTDIQTQYQYRTDLMVHVYGADIICEH